MKPFAQRRYFSVELFVHIVTLLISGSLNTHGSRRLNRKPGERCFSIVLPRIGPVSANI